MFDYGKLKDRISKAFEKVQDNETLKELGGILSDIDNAQKEQDTLSKEHEDLRTNYIKAVSTYSSKSNLEKEKPEKEITLEDCLKEEMKKQLAQKN